MSALGDNDTAATGGKHLKLTARQMELNTRWSFFKVQEHMGKGVDWEGRAVMSGPARDGISRNGYLPPGYAVVGDGLPREFRRPVAPYGIVRNIVSRFTGLLFSNRKQPRVGVPGDEDTEDWLNAQLVFGQFWSAMIQTRNYGGGMGSGCTGFKFVQGRCQFEALDPRWATAEFMGKGSQDLQRLTIEYTYVKEEKDLEGNWKPIWYWYRRVIDTETDTVWVPVKCKQKAPAWDYIQKNVVRHGLGFVPYEWVQNISEGADMDGEPDCAGIYEMVQAIDNLMTEVYSGTIKNLDPTLVLTTDASLGTLAKGSDNALKIPIGSSASYLELAGSGPTLGITVAKELEDRAYRLAQCVPDQVLFQNSGEKTALEIERVYSSMLERADDLREQYGPMIIRLCQKLLQAVRMWTAIREVPGPDGTTRFVRGKVYTPPKVVQQPDGDTLEVPRDMGKGTICEVKWPPYFRPTLSDVETALRICTTAKDAEVMTKATAIKFYAPYVSMDPLKEMHDLKKQEEANLAAQADAAATPEDAGADPGAEPAAEGEDPGADEGADPAAEDTGAAPSPSAPKTGPSMTPAAWKAGLDAGIVTLNEYRMGALGLGALPDGDLTMIQYRAKFAELFVANAAISSPAMAAKAMAGDGGAEAPGTPGKGGPLGQPPGRPNNAPGEPASGRPSPQVAGSEEALPSDEAPPGEPGASLPSGPPPQTASAPVASPPEEEAQPEEG